MFHQLTSSDFIPDNLNWKDKGNIVFLESFSLYRIKLNFVFNEVGAWL